MPNILVWKKNCYFICNYIVKLQLYLASYWFE